ncbi:MAG: type II secretion system GspH family protein [Lachnospiraceae bacterium]|nr:type II secretion system GspH family protein [Lachnospiraceae bacterium]
MRADQGYGTTSGKTVTEKSRRNAGFSMVELLVSVALLSVMTAVLLQSFIVARRLNARASTEQKLQTLAKTTMESMKAADLKLGELEEIARNEGVCRIDGITYQVSRTQNGIRLLYNDIGNGRGPVVSFGKQYGVYCEIDPAPYTGSSGANHQSGGNLAATYNSWPRPGVLSGGDMNRLVQLRVVIYRMDSRLAENGTEQIRFETARFMPGGGS